MKPIGPVLSPRLRGQFDAAQQRLASLKQAPAPAWPQHQLEALRSVWADAVADVPYYAELAATGRAPGIINSWHDVHAIPILTRDILQDQTAAFVRRSRSPQGVAKTAGSTGTPLQLGMDQAERDLMRVVKLASWQEMGYRSDSRVFIMWGHQHLLGTGWSGKLNHARRHLADLALGYRRVNAYRLNPQTCAAFAEAMIRFRPAAFISYASALDLFARYTPQYRRQFHELRLRFVLATTEPPPRPDTIALVEDLFGCPVVQEYGGGEFGQVAFAKGGEPFKVYADLNYVEAEGETAPPSPRPILVTSLYSRYVPLIRYRIGDAVVGAEVAAHGHVCQFHQIAGRMNDVIQLAGGDHIHSLAIFHCVHQEASVFNVQMVLFDDRIELWLVAPAADRPSLESRIRARLADVHPLLADVRFVYVDDVQTTRAGKRRWFVDQRTVSPCAGSRAS